jgi:hypothetical protein
VIGYIIKYIYQNNMSIGDGNFFLWPISGKFFPWNCRDFSGGLRLAPGSHPLKRERPALGKADPATAKIRKAIPWTILLVGKAIRR